LFISHLHNAEKEEGSPEDKKEGRQKASVINT
jgi:hypothetical protein